MTLKLRPLAEERALVSIPCDAARLGDLLDKLLSSRTRPIILDAVNRAAGEDFARLSQAAFPSSAWAVLVGYEGNADAVKWQVQQLVKELGASYPMEARIGFTSAALDGAMVEWSGTPDVKLTLKASLLPSRVAGFLQGAEALGSAPHLRAHAGNGIIVGHYSDVATERSLEIVRHWRETAGGPVVVERCPALWKRELNVWGPATGDRILMRQVKEQFDPRDLFNPGRVF